MECVGAGTEADVGAGMGTETGAASGDRARFE